MGIFAFCAFFTHGFWGTQKHLKVVRMVRLYPRGAPYFAPHNILQTKSRKHRQAQIPEGVAAITVEGTFMDETARRRFVVYEANRPFAWVHALSAEEAIRSALNKTGSIINVVAGAIPETPFLGQRRRPYTSRETL